MSEKFEVTAVLMVFSTTTETKGGWGVGQGTNEKSRA